MSSVKARLNLHLKHLPLLSLTNVGAMAMEIPVMNKFNLVAMGEMSKAIANMTKRRGPMTACSMGESWATKSR